MPNVNTVTEMTDLIGASRAYEANVTAMQTTNRQRSAHREAVGYFEEALSALAHLPETRATREHAIDLRLALRSALSPRGDLGRILAILREAEALAKPSMTRIGWARFQSFCATITA